MRNVAICGNKLGALLYGDSTIKSIQMDGTNVFCGLIHTQQPIFDSKALENCFNVVVRKKAFSCNYRDKNLIFKMATKGGNSSFYVIGSEFVGEVVDVGIQVNDLKIGDKVIPNNAYPNSGVEGLLPGVPTNNASKEYQVFHQTKLIKVPQEMPDEIAAGFSIGAQTTYSMIRKLNLIQGSNILVTAAKSNTSLFAINALRQHNVNVYATTTCKSFEKELKSMGVKEVILIDSFLNNFTENETIRDIMSNIGGFDSVIDPLFDIHLGKVIDVIAKGGKYITCGLYDQYSSLIGKKNNYKIPNFTAIMASVILKNIQIIGNCIGQTEDLLNAIIDYNFGSLNVVIDSQFTGDRIDRFLERTYNAKDRFGKVIYVYN